uniref:(+)-neomenthol dehydrogenase n=1 Tax=Oryza brachyantha TaxID=4533 RepID=J3LZV2_ORYBR
MASTPAKRRALAPEEVLKCKMSSARWAPDEPHAAACKDAERHRVASAVAAKLDRGRVHECAMYGVEFSMGVSAGQCSSSRQCSGGALGAVGSGGDAGVSLCSEFVHPRLSLVAAHKLMLQKPSGSPVPEQAISYPFLQSCWSSRCPFMESTIFSSTDTRIAVVTGGNKGIGLEVCRQLAGNGITVFLTARDEAKGAAAVDELHGLGLSNVIFHQLDVTDASSIARLAESLRSRFGRLDILVNNAAVGGIEPVNDPSFGLLPTEDKFNGMDGHQRVEWMWKNCRQTYDMAKAGLKTNFYGTKHVTETLLPLLQSSSDGRIVNVASSFGLLRFFRNEERKRELNDPDSLTDERLDELLDMFIKDFEVGAVAERGWPTEFSAYKVAKAAVNAHSRVLARKHPALRVNCVDPGYVKTDLTRNSGLLTPEEGASRVVAVALLPEGGPTGALFEGGKEASFV